MSRWIDRLRLESLNSLRRISSTEVWRWVLVTAITILIWVWAAGETKFVDRPINTARVQFTISDPEGWHIEPRDPQALTVVIEGSRKAIQSAEALLRRPLKLEVPAIEGEQTMDIIDRLRAHDLLRQTGARVTGANPNLIDVKLDKIVRNPAAVKPILHNVKTEGDIVIDPPEVIVAMPGDLRERLPSQLAVEAVVDRTELERLEPGVQQTVDVRVRPPQGISADAPVTITPAKVKLSFTIRSRIRETRLDNVPVQITAPVGDSDAFIVEVDPKQLQNVIISGEEDLMRRVESGEVQVVAVLHLRTREKEERIKSKAISYFMAQVPQANGLTSYVPVSGRIGASAEPPRIRLKITDRPQ